MYLTLCLNYSQSRAIFILPDVSEETSRAILLFRFVSFFPALRNVICYIGYVEIIFVLHRLYIFLLIKWEVIFNLNEKLEGKLKEFYKIQKNCTNFI